MPRSLAIARRLFAAAALMTAACAHPKPGVGLVPATPIGDVASVAAACDGCATAPLGAEVMRAVAQRVADLKARGGACEVYGTVLEASLASQHISVRPFMWRVGTHLASAQAQSTGQIMVARDVDSLNVGVRSLDDVVHSVEHEAAHIAFAIPSGGEWTEAQVDARVGECRTQVARSGPSP